jgi:predicted MFS family arabinose efflux permease
MRLGPKSDVHRALSIIFSGVSVALVISAPVGTLLGAIINWRGVFGLTALLGLCCLVWQIQTLPTMPAEREGMSPNMTEVAKRSYILIAMLAIFFCFSGQFAFFTYMPFFEKCHKA